MPGKRRGASFGGQTLTAHAWLSLGSVAYPIYHFWLSTSPSPSFDFCSRAATTPATSAAAAASSSPAADEAATLTFLLYFLAEETKLRKSPVATRLVSRHGRFSDIFHFYDCVYYQQPRTFRRLFRINCNDTAGHVYLAIEFDRFQFGS